MKLNCDLCVFHYLKLEMSSYFTISDMGFHNNRLNSGQLGNNRSVEFQEFGAVIGLKL